jgi:hypothetical protein
VDVEHAQSRIRNGQVGYDALRVLRSCGDPMPYFTRVLDAFEVAGFLSNEDRRSLLDSELDVDERHALGTDLGVRAQDRRVLLGERAADGRGAGRIESRHGAV